MVHGDEGVRKVLLRDCRVHKVPAAQTFTGKAEQHGTGGKNQQPLDKSAENRRLKLMGLKTALAIAIHNFPEGLATFVATLDDVHVGLAMAVGIAIHNIPEGLCVSIPIYYATGTIFVWKRHHKNTHHEDTTL